MATDSTELTFVRCPSCRSLVPAVSTRCRMCGAGLDASGEGDDLERDQKKSGRVRQRTMSQAQSELNSAVAKLRAGDQTPAPDTTPSASVTPPPVQPVVAAPPADVLADEPLEDPLSAYIEEVDESDPSKTMERQVPAPVAEAASEMNGNGHAAEEDPAPASIAPRSERIIAAPQVPQRPSAPEKAPEMAAAPSAKAAQPESEHEEDTQGQRVIVESGLRRHGRPSGLSFTRGREEHKPQSGSHAHPAAEKQAQHKPASQPERQPNRHEQHERQERSGGTQHHREDRRERQAPPAQQAQPQRQREPERREPDRREPERREPERKEHDRREPPRERPERSAQPAAHANDGLKRSEQSAGRLFGWLVSYSHPDGAATELREGKFFVTGSSLKASDLIIDDPSISTPHALVSIGVDLGLQVQDLMSDRGVFVRRRGDDTYRREGDVVRVEHGDWVRFGDVEYLVSLIAHVGVK